MNRLSFARHQQLLVRSLQLTHELDVRISNDMNDLVRTYAALSETGYVQLPFKVEKCNEVPSSHFWVSLRHGSQTIALAAVRVLSNGPRAQTCASFFADEGLYPRQGTKREAYLEERGPMLAPHDRFAYLGAGWVHPKWRGRNLAGWISRIAYDEAIVRTRGMLAMLSAMTFEPMFKAGLNMRASCWHHTEAELILDGYLAALDRDLRMYLSHNTMADHSALYNKELSYLDKGMPVPWLRGKERTPARVIISALRR